MKKAFSIRGMACFPANKSGLQTVPYAGIIQIRFDGFNLRLFSHPEP
jgi:hypothetical protein